MDRTATIKDNKAVCNHCDTKMLLINMNKYQTKWSFSLLFLGLLSFFFIHLGGPIIGLPLIIIGTYLIITKHTVSMCPGCGYYFPVMIVKKDEQKT